MAESQKERVKRQREEGKARSLAIAQAASAKKAAANIKAIKDARAAEKTKTTTKK